MPAYPVWATLPYTLLVAVIVPVYWSEYGPGNFLWFSDIAMFAVLISLWTGNRLVYSMMAVGVLPFEIIWVADIVVKDRQEYQVGDPLLLQSSSFTADGNIPAKHSDYHLGLSVQLSWPAVQGAKSYVLIAEDPDSKPITPFVHWVAYNIPATTTQLPEGLTTTERLTQPEGMLQGRNTRGSTGYFGPRPPIGDSAHRYYFQVLALDTTLDLLPGASRDEVLSAAHGHVIGHGNLMGHYQQKNPPKK